MKNEVERDAPLSVWECVAAGVGVLWFVLFALALTIVVGCGKSVDVEGKGMYANANSGVVGIGSFEVVTVPDGNEAARIQYSEDTAWLSPSTKTHAFKINLCGTNSVDQVGGIVENICQAFIATAPQIAAINSGSDVTVPTNGPGAIVTKALTAKTDVESVSVSVPDVVSNAVKAVAAASVCTNCSVTAAADCTNCTATAAANCTNCTATAVKSE